LIPVMPMIALLAAYCMFELADLAGRRAPVLRPTFLAIAAVLLLGQGAVYSLHIGLVLSRPDTRNLTRDWMVANVPEGGRIVVEPTAPDAWAQDVGKPSTVTSNGNRWPKFPTSRANTLPDGSFAAGQGPVVNIEDYERTLRPELIPYYESKGYCYVVSGSTQRGRAEAEPEVVPRAIAYYAELDRDATIVHQDSPYAAGRRDVPFNFDFSFDYYPLAYHRPGPLMTVYRLNGGKCAPGATTNR
jgi:hypothetical protein